MNKMNNYLIFNFSKILLNVILLSFCLGLILNLFEEVEFFKNSGESLLLPLTLTLSYIPNLIFINLMPFIVFVSAMWFFISIKHNNELLTLKVFGYSNAKIILLISTLSFLWGLLILVVINPITSDMVKFYEKTKSNYSKDTDHLVTINRNGVWIKENKKDNLFIINADRLENNNLIDVSINIISKENIIIERIEAERANILLNTWKIKKAKIFNFDKEGNVTIKNKEYTDFISFYNVDKLNNLFKNLDTISFLN